MRYGFVRRQFHCLREVFRRLAIIGLLVIKVTQGLMIPVLFRFQFNRPAIRP